jgi:hypothetical protein
MKLHIEGGILYTGGLMFSRVGAGNGKPHLPLGVFEVEVRTATQHGSIPLAWADGIGWIGGLGGCDAVLGRVVGQYGVLPCLSTARRLVSLVESALEAGERVTLEVQL